MDIRYTPEPPLPEDFESVPHWFVVMPRSVLEQGWPDVLYGEVLHQRYRRRFPEQPEDKPLALELPNAVGTRVGLLLLPDDVSMFQQLGWGRELFELFKEDMPQALGVWLVGIAPEQQTQLLDALLSAALAGSAALPSMKSRPIPHADLQRILVYGVEREIDSARLLAIHAGNYLARSLAVLPPNQLTPALYRDRVEALAKEHGWHMEFYDLAKLRAKGAGAFLAVAQGSAGAEAGIVRLRYTPPGPPTHKVAVVGKGICFDTGGHNLKTAKGMQHMHQDMQGSAVALGTLLALSLLQVDFSVECWLALAENHIGPLAYKPHDVVVAANGTSIEIVHTDAEGRLVLADTLYFASQEKPDLMMDYATLTGTCAAALGTRYCGVLTNRPALWPTLIEAGQSSGERVWPFPLDPDYEEDLDSEVADIKQCLLDNDADHILASRLLLRFVGDAPWIHMDLSAFCREKGLAHIPTETTGFGVRYSIHLLLDYRERVLA